MIKINFKISQRLAFKIILGLPFTYRVVSIESRGLGVKDTEGSMRIRVSVISFLKRKVS